jgi:hypothetical protein
LDKLQDAKRILDDGDSLIIEADGKTYEVDLTKTWNASDVVPVSETTERCSEGTLILTIKKPDFIGAGKWQFVHGSAVVNASIKDEQWLARFHGGKFGLHSGDAMRCKVRFTYVFDAKGKIIEQKTEILKVLKIIRGPGSQTDMFSD